MLQSMWGIGIELPLFMCDECLE